MLIEVKGVSKSYGGVKALDDCTFTVPEGQITCLVGPNGAGKTTVFNAITGFLGPDSGTVRFRGVDITTEQPARIVSMGIARTFQDLRLFQEMTVRDNIIVFQPEENRSDSAVTALLRPFGTERNLRARRAEAEALLDQVGLGGRGDELVRNISYGDQKLLSIARVLATRAQVLLLDEPASGLSHSGLEKMKEIIFQLKAAGHSLLVVEHNIRIVQQLADELLFLHQGHLVQQGRPDTIMNDPRLAEIYFGGAI